MKYNKEKIGKIIRSEREKLGWSQETLGKKLFITGKQISIYENGKLPPLDNLLNLCEQFNCELGYLLGEPQYTKGTQMYTEIYDLTGLSNESINTLNHITGSNSKYPFKREVNEFRDILNSFMCASNFKTLILNLHDLYSCGNTITKLQQEFNSKYDEKTIQTALNMELDLNDYEHDETLPELSQEIIDANLELNIILDKKHDMQYPQKIARYEINEAFIMLLNEIFDSEGNLKNSNL